MSDGPRTQPDTRALRASPGIAPRRLLAVDVMRGLVILLLVPDVSGGFSLPKMAERFPDSALWTALGHQFSHAPWTGPRLWDFVMPAFVFLVGVSIHLSHVARSAAGQPYARLLGRAVLRAVALVLVGLMISYSVASRADELWPFIVIAIGFPIADVMQRLGRSPLAERLARVQRLLYPAVLVAAAVWLAFRLSRTAWDFNNILVQIGLGYLAAFVLVRSSPARQALVAAALLVAYAMAFFAYSPPAGVQAVGETFQGLAASWNNGTNVAAAFDRWLLNALPRASPYTGNPHGAHTLQFVALIPTMIGGMLAARCLLGDAVADGRLREPPATGTARVPGGRTAFGGTAFGATALGGMAMPRTARLALAGAACIGVGLLLTLFAIPIVKWLWTPSWALISLGACVIALAALVALTSAAPAARAWTPLVVLGSNSILLYVISVNERWRIVALGERVLGRTLTEAPWEPFIESCLVLAALWLLAWALFRARILFRL